VTVIIRWHSSLHGDADPVQVRPASFKTKEIYLTMAIRKNSLVLTAAFTGLLSGTMVRVNAAPASDGSNPAMSGLAGKLSTASDAKKEKHACKGENPAKVKAAAARAITAAKARIPVRARAVAQPTARRRRSRIT
jgi:hypothetical protein